MSVALCGNIDLVILIGGLAYNKSLTTWVLNGEEVPKVYENEIAI